MGTYSWEQEVCKAKTFLVQYSGKFKVFGIHFNLYKEDKSFKKFSENIKKVKNILSS
jgi:hypothetical protein